MDYLAAPVIGVSGTPNSTTHSENGIAKCISYWMPLAGFVDAFCFVLLQFFAYLWSICWNIRIYVDYMFKILVLRELGRYKHMSKHLCFQKNVGLHQVHP